jgi:hypothetical protein
VGAGVLTGSAFSIRFGKTPCSPSAFFFGPDFGVGDSSGSGVGLFLAADFFDGSGVSFAPAFFFRFDFGVVSLSFLVDFSAPGVALGLGGGVGGG